MTAIYVDVDDLKSSLSASGTTYMDNDLERAAAAASEDVENTTGRTFDTPAADSTRYFDTRDPRRLRIDDILSVTSLDVDRDGDGVYEESWVEGTDYRLEPPNAATDGRPYTVVAPLRSAGRALPTREQTSVKVVGMFGWPETPSSILEYAQILATKLVIRKRQAPLGFEISGETAAHISRNDPDLQRLIGPYGQPKTRSLQLT